MEKLSYFCIILCFFLQRGFSKFLFSLICLYLSTKLIFFPDVSVTLLIPQASEALIYCFLDFSHAIIGDIIKGYYIVHSCLFLFSSLKTHPKLCSLLSEVRLLSPQLQFSDPLATSVLWTTAFVCIIPRLTTLIALFSPILKYVCEYFLNILPSCKMWPLQNHHWQYPAFPEHKYPSSGPTAVLQTHPFPYCFIAFSPPGLRARLTSVRI